MVMDMNNNPLINPKTGQPIVGNVRKKVIEKNYDWGLYVYKKSNGKWFTDGQGNVLNIESMRGDIAQIAKLKDENESLWYMLEEIEQSNIAGREAIAESLKSLKNFKTAINAKPAEA